MTPGRKTHSVNFDDLLRLRLGEPDMDRGGGASRVETLGSLDQWKLKAAALRDLYRATLGHPPEHHSGEPAVQVVRETRGGYTTRIIAYDTGPNERVSAYMLIPDGLSGPAPAILCLHQTTPLGKEQVVGNDSSPQGQDLAIALHLVRRGFITFSYDLVSAGQRRYPDCEHFDTAPFYNRFPDWSVRGKDLHDVSVAIDVMQTMPEIDPERIGSIGHSQGGGVTIHAMVTEPRIRIGVCNCGVWPYRLSKNPFVEARTAWWTGRPLLRPYCVTGKPFPVDIHEMLALAAPRPIMNIVALNDFEHDASETQVTAAAFDNMAHNVKRVYSLYDEESNFVQLTHVEGHSFKPQCRERAYDFLHAHLGGSAATVAE